MPNYTYVKSPIILSSIYIVEFVFLTKINFIFCRKCYSTFWAIIIERFVTETQEEEIEEFMNSA